MNKKLIALIVGGVVVAGAAFYGNTTAQLHAVNPLPFPVTVTVDGKAFPLSGDGRAELGRFSAGEHTLVTTRGDGKELERLTILTSSGGTNVYSVFGAAPLTLDAIFYATSRGSAPEPRRTSQCGQPPFQVHHVDYAFEDPPEKVDMPRGSSSVQRTVLRLGQGGYAACIMSPAPDAGALAELTLKIAAAFDKPEEQQRLTWWAVDLFGRAGKKQRALELVEPLLDSPKATLDDHRALQDLMRSVGRRKELLGRYKARYEKDQTAQNAYLYARVLDSEPSLAVDDAALVKWPDDPWLRRSRMWNLDVLGESAKALVEADWFLAKPKGPDDASMRDFVRELKVRALVNLGRQADALDFLKAEFEPEKDWSFADAILVARVARAAKQKPWVDPFTRIPAKAPDTDGLFRYFYELSVGGSQPGKPAVLNGTPFNAFEVLAEARTTPELALNRLAKMDPTLDLYLSPEQAWVLLVEAWRVGNEPAAKKVAGYLRQAGDLDAAREFVTGSEADEAALRDAQPEARAALLLGRARTLEARGDHAGAGVYLARLQKADPLGGLASRAAVDWTARGAPAPQEHTRIREAGKVKLE